MGTDAMQPQTAAVIAVGSQGRVHLHALGQRADVAVVAVADPDRELAERVAAAAGVPAVYPDHRALLAAERIDILSVCTPPGLHRGIVEDAVAAGVRAIHCEKPVALTFGDVRAMRDLCRERGVQLTINHQRRFETVYRDVRDVIAAGGIGRLTMLEGYCANLFDWGSHVLDLLLFLGGDDAPETVFGQIDVDTVRRIYGAIAETASVTRLHWADGRNAMVVTGRGPAHLAVGTDTGIVLHGTEGRIEIAHSRAVVRTFDGTVRELESRVEERNRVDLGGADATIIQATSDGIADLVEALRDGREPELDIRHGMAAAELIFATYESSARRGSVRLPLETDDNALLRGIAEGFWTPVGETVGTF
jgi:UDP-N-acetylglucosamine 3-dehydrogenase